MQDTLLHHPYLKCISPACLTTVIQEMSAIPGAVLAHGQTLHNHAPTNWSVMSHGRRSLAQGSTIHEDNKDSCLPTHVPLE